MKVCFNAIAIYTHYTVCKLFPLTWNRNWKLKIKPNDALKQVSLSPMNIVLNVLAYLLWYLKFEFLKNILSECSAMPGDLHNHPLSEKQEQIWGESCAQLVACFNPTPIAGVVVILCMVGNSSQKHHFTPEVALGGRVGWGWRLNG